MGSGSGCAVGAGGSPGRVEARRPWID
jgi:hypothetical protein